MRILRRALFVFGAASFSVISHSAFADTFDERMKQIERLFTMADSALAQMPKTAPPLPPAPAIAIIVQQPPVPDAPPPLPVTPGPKTQPVKPDTPVRPPMPIIAESDVSFSCPYKLKEIGEQLVTYSEESQQVDAVVKRLDEVLMNSRMTRLTPENLNGCSRDLVRGIDRVADGVAELNMTEKLEAVEELRDCADLLDARVKKDMSEATAAGDVSRGMQLSSYQREITDNQSTAQDLLLFFTRADAKAIRLERENSDYRRQCESTEGKKTDVY